MDNVCVPCGNGTFIAQNNHTDEACSVWSTCPPGEGRVRDHIMSTTLDVKCESCDLTDENEKQFSMGHDYSACSDHMPCPPGFGSNLDLVIDINGGSSYVSTCTPCALGTYSDSKDFKPCKADITVCLAGEYFVKQNATSNSTTG